MLELVEDKNHNVIKRDGRIEKYNQKKLKKALDWCTQSDILTKQLLGALDLKIYDKIRIDKLWDEVIATAANMISEMYPIWDNVAKRAYLLKIYKETYNNKVITDGYYPNYYDIIKKGISSNVYSSDILKYFTEDEINTLGSYIKMERDLNFSFIGLVTLMEKYSKNYSLNKKLELPQHVYMRVAIMPFMYEKNSEEKLKKIKKRYDDLSTFKYTEATPKMVNSLTIVSQLASCVLQEVDDNIESINHVDSSLSIYSKYGGGLAVDVSKLRCSNSPIGKSGRSDGPVPFIRKFENTVTAFNQGGTRKGAAVITFPFWHYDSPDMIMLKDAGGSDDKRARNLQYAVKWYNIFTKRIIEGSDIILFDPKDVPELNNTYGADFEKWYLYYENKSNVRKRKIPARELAFLIAKVRSETGNLYITFIDNINKNRMGEEPVFSSNLCLKGDTKVQTDKGTKEIKDIKIGDKVYTRNIETGRTEIKKVTNSAMTNPKAKVMKITDEETGNFIICTPEHKIWTENRGYVEAKNLVPDDILYKRIEQNGKIKTYLEKKEKSLIKIEYLEEEIPVYDITVQDNHNFYGNNILVHNCQEIVIPCKASTNFKTELLSSIDGTKTIVTNSSENGEIGLCNLSSINIMEWIKLSEEEKIALIDNLLEASDNLIDIQSYPVKEGETANKRRRAIGIGVSNYAYYLASNNVLWTDKKAEELTFYLFEDIYYHIYSGSVRLAKKRGPYYYFRKSNWAKGFLPIYANKTKYVLKRDWNELSNDIITYGTRFSYHGAIAPTATSSQIIQAVDGVEPVKKIFQMKEGTYNLPIIVPELRKYREFYQNAFDIPVKTVNRLASIRQIFLDQSQSFSHYYKITDSAYNIIKDIIDAEESGIKTLYYLQPMKSEDDDTEIEHCEHCSA